MMTFTPDQILRYRRWLWRSLLALGVLGVLVFALRNVILGKPVEAF